MAGCEEARFYLAECELPARRAADRYGVQVTIHEGGRGVGMGFTRMVTSRDEARPVWREQARRLRAVGYRQSD